MNAPLASKEAFFMPEKSEKNNVSNIGTIPFLV